MQQPKQKDIINDFRQLRNSLKPVLSSKNMKIMQEAENALATGQKKITPLAIASATHEERVAKYLRF